MLMWQHFPMAYYQYMTDAYKAALADYQTPYPELI